MNRSTASTSPLLSAANNDLAPLSTEPSSHSPVHEKASRVRRGGLDVAGICPFHLPPDIFGHGTSAEVGRRRMRGRKREEESGKQAWTKSYIAFIARDEVPSKRLFSVCSPATERGNPPSRSFVATKTVSGVVDTRQESHSSLSLHLFFPPWNMFVHLSLFLSLFLSLVPSPSDPRIPCGHCRDFHCARQRRRRGSTDCPSRQ